MNEEIVVTEAEEDWSEVTADETVEETPQEEADQPEPVEEDKDEKESTPEEKPDDKTEDKPAQTSFKVKHLGEEKEISLEEAPTLIQKGLDYDRIKTRNDEADAFKRKFDDLARENGVAPDAFIEQIINSLDESKAREISEREGIEFKTALRDVKVDRREKALKAAEEAEAKRKADADIEAKKANERKETEVAEFLKAHPDVDQTKIAKEVWDEVKKGRSLLNAYDAWDVKQQKAAIEAEKKNLENKQKSTGSQQTAGKKQSDKFGFDDFNTDL